MLRLLILLLAFSATSVDATEIISCEARATSGTHKEVDYKTYPIIYPTILINEASNLLTYVYSQHGQKWEIVYNISLKTENFIIGIQEFGETVINIFHYDKREKTFNRMWSGAQFGPLGNTFTIGKCFD